MKIVIAICTLSLGLGAVAVADTVSFAGGGDLGTSHNYTLDTATIVAKGFDSSSSTGHLFGKGLGGDESGLGLKDDPSGEGEIWYASSTTSLKPFVQLDVSDLLTKGYTNIQFEMGSTTQGETWQVAACGTSGTLCTTSAVSGTGELSFHSAPSNLSSSHHYLDFTSIANTGGKNVLLFALSATAPSSVPEPRFYGLLLAGMVGLVGMFLRNRRTA